MYPAVPGTADGWPTQAIFWLERCSSAAGQNPGLDRPRVPHPNVVLFDVRVGILTLSRHLRTKASLGDKPTTQCAPPCEVMAGNLQSLLENSFLGRPSGTNARRFQPRRDEPGRQRWEKAVQTIQARRDDTPLFVAQRFQRCGYTSL